MKDTHKNININNECKQILVPKQPIDIQPLQPTREIEIYESLMKIDSLKNFFETHIERIKPHRIRRKLLKNAMRITPRMSPMLTNLLDVGLKIIKVDFDVELFVTASADFKSKTYYDENDKIVYVVVNSALLERLNQQELLFMLGHDIANVRFRYDKLDVQLALDKGRKILIPRTILQLISWQRYATMTCDRAGLLCCQCFNTAATTLFKITSGVTTGLLQFNVDDYLKQLEDVKTLEEVDETHEDWFDLKPFSPLRIKALELFSTSDVFKNSINDTSESVPLAEIEKTIDSFMQILNPSYIGQENELADKMKDWLAYASALVALANGEMVSEEINTIISIIGYDKTMAILADVKNKDIDWIFEKVRKLGEAVWVQATRIQRLQMMRDLVTIAASDGSVDEYEYYALTDLATMIDVQTNFLTDVINELTIEVDGDTKTKFIKSNTEFNEDDHVIANTQIVNSQNSLKTDMQASIETIQQDLAEVNENSKDKESD